ncbi:hypothetical protein CRG98_040457 [Punica granatum]|uniref:Uncharacterized protein n=1 Tax=Punica granatum TaxID=22663 RepID=A0A2I0I6W1_PUNGR|nr:hypothetical protein CRG98_040457 [Punica granatum]
MAHETSEPRLVQRPRAPLALALAMFRHAKANRVQPASYDKAPCVINHLGINIDISGTSHGLLCLPTIYDVFQTLYADGHNPPIRAYEEVAERFYILTSPETYHQEEKKLTLRKEAQGNST